MLLRRREKEGSSMQIEIVEGAVSTNLISKKKKIYRIMN